MLGLFVFVKYYIFSLIKLKHWLAPPFIPWIGAQINFLNKNS
jgi:hypothetical protein